LAPPERKVSTPWEQAGIYSGLGFVLFGGIAGGYLLGSLLDSRVGTRLIFALLLATAGFAGALFEILRILDRLEKRASRDDSDSGRDAS
jgi:F0F1-type ATP synthase assembly protein I